MNAIGGMVMRRRAGLADRARSWVRNGPTGLVAIALGIGVGGGLGAIAFRYLIVWFTRLFSGHDDYSAAGHAAHPWFPALGPWFVVLAPVIGGLIYGPLIHFFAREARGHGVPEVMFAVAEKGGRIPPQVAIVKSLASALCIGAGGSVGREGPIVQIGSALGSSVGQLLKLSESRLRILVACGAAAGISATFNAPIAGVLFSLELILQDFGAESFGVVVLSSVTAAAIGRAAFGSDPFLMLPPFHLVSNWEFGAYAGLGVVAGVVGVVFIRVLYGFEDMADRIWRGPEWLRPAVGGVLLGLLLLALPQMYGVGYPVLAGGIRGQYVIGFLVVLLVAKMVATSLTISIGGSGGVFAPSLFIGAMLGEAFGQAIHLIVPGAGPAGAYALVGMGAVFAAAARAPITAVIILFELTGDYTIILPLMVAIVLSAGVSNLLSRDTIYTLKLRRRGIDIMRGKSANLMRLVLVQDAMQAVPETVPAACGLDALVRRFAAAENDVLPVTDSAGGLVGLLHAREVEIAMAANRLDATAGELAEMSVGVPVGANLEDALTRLVSEGVSGLPVASDDSATVVGWITHRDILHAYHNSLSAGAATAERIAVGARVLPGPASPDLDGYRVVRVDMPGDQKSRDCLVRDVRWPKGSLVMAVRRTDGTVVIPVGDTVLSRGDQLTLLTRPDQLEQVIDSIRASDQSSDAGRKRSSESHSAPR